MNYPKEFYEGNEVLFVGYSSKNQAFSKMIYQAFTDNGIQVYPMNSKEDGSYDVKVYHSFDQIPKMPATAYLLLNKENIKKVLPKIAEKGVKKVQFQNKKYIDDAIVNECQTLGIETLAACPMMKFGKGFHRFHAFLAGVK